MKQHRTRVRNGSIYSSRAVSHAHKRISPERPKTRNIICACLRAEPPQNRNIYHQSHTVSLIMPPARRHQQAPLSVMKETHKHKFIFTSHTVIHKAIWASQRGVGGCSRQPGPVIHTAMGSVTGHRPGAMQGKAIEQNSKEGKLSDAAVAPDLSPQLTSPEAPQPVIAGLVLQCQNDVI